LSSLFLPPPSTKGKHKLVDDTRLYCPPPSFHSQRSTGRIRLPETRSRSRFWPHERPRVTAIQRPFGDQTGREPAGSGRAPRPLAGRRWGRLPRRPSVRPLGAQATTPPNERLTRPLPSGFTSVTAAVRASASLAAVGDQAGLPVPRSTTRPPSGKSTQVSGAT